MIILFVQIGEDSASAFTQFDYRAFSSINENKDGISQNESKTYI